MSMKTYSAIALLIILASCAGNGSEPDHDDSIVPKPIPAIGYNVVAQYPHDTSAYTQGLQIYKGKLYEGTGDYENSSLRITDIKSGKVEQKHMMGSDKIFGEGINIFGDKIYQLTWKTHVVYVYNLNNINQPISTLPWPYEGWGLTNNGTDLIVSDGTANLYFVNPADFKVRSTIAVTDNGGPVQELNELEYIDGFVFANVWQTNIIVKIDPSSGHVVGRMDLSDLQNTYFKDQVTERTDVLNGIAYDSSSKKLYITGKRWPKMFEVTLK